MTTLHLMHGFIGSGKTTFAKQLERRTGALRLSHDEWMIAFHGTNPPGDTIARFEEQLTALLWRWAAAELKRGRDVILDYGFWSRTTRNEMRDKATNLGVEVKLYATHTSREDMLKRTLARTALMPAGALVIDESAFNILWPHYQPLEADEAAVLF